MGIGGTSNEWGSVSDIRIVSNWSMSNGSVSRVAYPNVGLANGRIRGVDGFGVRRDLAQVSIGSQDVGLLASHGGS